MSVLSRIWGNALKVVKLASPLAAGATIGTRAIPLHGVKQGVAADPVVALKYYVEDGKLVVKSVLYSEMYGDADTDGS